MAAIFEHRKIESNDLGNELKFPVDAILTNLSPEDHSNLSSGKCPELVVKDDQGGTHWLTIKKQSGKICFTNGWKKFINEKGIKKNDEISLYKEDNHFDPGAQCTYRIEVKKAKRGR
ncbi:hypothetical protein SLE2022_040210 [Rubroshorea leprosula]